MKLPADMICKNGSVPKKVFAVSVHEERIGRMPGKEEKDEMPEL